MDKKLLGVIALTIIVILLFITFIIISQKTKLSPLKQEILENCNNLIYNNPEAINLVFFSNKKQAEEYSDFFFKTSPFDKNKKSFNIYYIDDYIPKCELYKEVAILCYSKELIKKSASCPNDYVIVIKNENPEIRSSSYMNVLSINKEHPLSVLIHEFGHSFANLAEEYTPADIPSGSKNCVFKCEDFGDKKDGCFKGCSKNNAFRSIESGVMKTLSTNDYGIFDERLILNRIEEKTPKGITGNVISSALNCSQNHYYLIEAVYDGIKINLNKKSIEVGCIGDNGAGPFSYNIIKKNGEIIRGNEFNPELIFTDVQGNETIIGETYKQEGPFLLKIPVIDNSKTLEINKNSQKIGEINLKDIGARPCII